MTHGLHVEAVEGRRVSWLGHLARSIFTLRVYDLWRLSDIKHVYRPQVVLVNETGESHRLFSVTSYEEAVTKRDRLRSELDEMPVEAWCDRYVVPATFANPHDAWRPPTAE